MSRFFSYINSSKKILDAYDGMQPFPFHIKKHFAANKNFGSKDRKTIAEICYAWLRTSHLFGRNLQDENIIHALFLCVDTQHPLLAALQPELNKKVSLGSGEKLSFLQLSAGSIFPFENELGNIDHEKFVLSFFQQPLLFLRLRPGKEKAVIAKLENAAVSFSMLSANAVSLPNATKLEGIIDINKDAVVQDSNSQKVFDHLREQSLTPSLEFPWFVSPRTTSEKIPVWDCCAASGGKSILLFDQLNGKIKLTVSDIRPAILKNLKKRLQEAGININRAFVADVSNDIAEEIEKEFSIIICDAPCTGSGTWSRTPEQLAYFKTGKINEFAALQKSIAINTSKYLKKDGLYFYITCSVFKKENEEVAEALAKDTGMKLLHKKYLEGYNHHADTMFVAVLKK
ncbi:MAG: methyltransferase domain-containing protein [Rhizobacter sp.]|nr:methyltransferase domain-containing protein [Ferruginibacter sp.]